MYGKRLDRLRLAILQDLEVVGRETADEVSLSVGDRHVHIDEVDGGLERGLLRGDRS
jgi:hypothetical protein